MPSATSSPRASPSCSSSWSCPTLPLVLYTLCRGPKGRHALLIYAALLLIGAVVPATVFIQSLNRLTSSIHLGDHLSLIYDIAPAAFALHTLALAAAFPLAIRMALTLSAVRESLDGRHDP